MRDLLLLAITAACSFIGLLNPFFGLLAYVGYGILGPQSYTHTISLTFPHSKLIALSTLVGFLFSSEVKRFVRQRETIFLFALWIMFCFSTIFAFAPDRAIEDFVIISKVLLMSLLLTCVITTEHRLHLALKVLALGLGLYALKGGLFVFMSGGIAPIEGPRDTYLEGNNTLGMALAINVPLLFYLSKIEPNSWLRLIMRLMLVFSYVAVAGTFARGNWIGLAAVTALMLLKSKKKVLTWCAAAICICVAVAWAPYLMSEQMTNRYDSIQNHSEDPSVQSRYWNWEFCRRVGMNTPLIGAGFRFYSLEAYGRYYPEFLERWPGKVWSCHNMWLSVFAEHGVVTLLLWLGLFGSCLLSTRQIASSARGQDAAAWAEPYADMLQVSFVGFSIMGSFVDFAYYEGYYQLVAATITLKEIVRQAVRASPTNPALILVRKAPNDVGEFVNQAGKRLA